MIVDVDCTLAGSKQLCAKYGVSGYPTLKFFGPNLAPEGESFEGGRDFAAMSTFVKAKSKKPCAPDTLENCDPKDKAYLAEIQDFSAEQIQEELDRYEKELDNLNAAHTELNSLFTKQRDQAMATMQKAKDAKKKMDGLRGIVGYKLALLRAKASTPKIDEL
mmetsp:Transcript_91579/g.285440  ORF Transcript_91579/g.285440 Transcript_91579/m.285440 type:complete len:162 (+) Transcript_91579:311-796(+)